LKRPDTLPHYLNAHFGSIQKPEEEKTVNRTKTILLGLCLFALSLTGWSQNVNRPPVPGIPGYLDARTGTFKPMPQAVANEDEAPVNPTTGKVVLTLTVTLQSTFPTNEVYSCGLTASTLDISSTLSFFDSFQVAGKKSGNTLTCAITLPYSWALVSAPSDTMSISYSVDASAPTVGLPTRLAEHGIANIKVPPSGTTTTYTLSTVI
jgi:hypothetical protein